MFHIFPSGPPASQKTDLNCNIATLKLNIIFQIIFSLLTTYNSADAQINTTLKAKQPVSIQQVARMFSLSPSSPELKMLHAEKPSWGWKNRGKDQPLISHIKGDRGIPLPTLASVKKNLLPRKKDLEAFLNLSYKKNIEAAKELAKKRNYTNPDKLGFCSESRTKIKEKILPESLNKKKKIQKKEKVRYDVLVIEPQDLPSDPKAAFGKKTRTLKYYKDPRKRAYAVSQLGISCIPSRVRITREKVFTYEGLDAVKNYDASTEGELHPQMKHMKTFW